MDPTKVEGGTAYIIHIHGTLDPVWSHWFDDMTITGSDDGTTVLRGVVPDQTALYGIIGRLRDLGLALVRCNPESRHDEDLLEEYPCICHREPCPRRSLAPGLPHPGAARCDTDERSKEQPS
jgi:hypothetical protein